MIGRRWLRPVALTLVASVACVLLGFWQLDRRATRLAAIAVVEGNWDAVPRSPDAALPRAGSPLAPSREFTPVEVTGAYDPSGTLLVRNRPQGGNYGYYVLVPLVLAPSAAGAAGSTLVVNRGWIPSGENGSAPDEVPPPPSGTVTEVVRLRAPEAPDGRGAPRGQVQRVDVGGTVRRALAAEGADDPGLVTGAYGQLAAGAVGSAGPAGPAPVPQPDADPGPHLGYSVQWFVFAAGMWALLGVHVRRTRAEEGASAAGLPSPALAARERARARRRVDEDAEDAVLDAAEIR